MTSWVSLVFANIYLIFSTIFFALKAFPVRSSLTPPCCPYAISKDKCGKYTKQVSNGHLQIEVWTASLWKCRIYIIFSSQVLYDLAVTHQKPHQSTFDYFYLPIYLWMEYCRPLQLYAHLLPACSPKCTNNFPIWNDVPWYPKVQSKLSKEKVYCFLFINGILTRNENEHLFEAISYHK